MSCLSPWDKNNNRLLICSLIRTTYKGTGGHRLLDSSCRDHSVQHQPGDINESATQNKTESVEIFIQRNEEMSPCEEDGCGSSNRLAIVREREWEIPTQDKNQDEREDIRDALCLCLRVRKDLQPNKTHDERRWGIEDWEEEQHTSPSTSSCLWKKVLLVASLPSSSSSPLSFPLLFLPLLLLPSSDFSAFVPAQVSCLIT